MSSYNNIHNNKAFEQMRKQAYEAQRLFRQYEIATAGITSLHLEQHAKLVSMMQPLHAEYERATRLAAQIFENTRFTEQLVNHIGMINTAYLTSESINRHLDEITKTVTSPTFQGNKDEAVEAEEIKPILKLIDEINEHTISELNANEVVPDLNRVDVQHIDTEANATAEIISGSDKPTTKGKVLTLLYKIVEAISVKVVVEGAFSSAPALLAKLNDIIDNWSS